MKRSLFAGFLAATLITVPAFAEDFKSGSLVIDHPWARATAVTAKNGAVFMKIDNKGSGGDKLISASGQVADMIQLHTNIDDNGVMKMREVKAIDVGPGKSVELKPGGYHVMLIGLKAPLKEGDSFPLKLMFEKAGAVEVTVKIDKAGAMGGHMGH